MKVLGLETSCDETAACILESPRRILSNVISSQIALHHEYGGVVPELASRRHVEMMGPVIEESLTRAGCDLTSVDLISVTVGPGLLGSLLMGVTFAKTLSYAIEKPLIGVNHLEAHFYAPFLEDPELKFPLVSLIVSGGHTLLVWVKGLGQYEILGCTFDDAAGEAYDKVAKLLGLGYPGGPVIDQLAQKGNPKVFRLPKPYLSKNSLDFSFSGLKTAVLYLVKGYGSRNTGSTPFKKGRIEDLAASFQEVVVEVLTKKCMIALEKTGVENLAMGGGVAANSRLRERLTELAQKKGFHLSLPSKTLCTDNAAMIAALGLARFEAGLPGEPLEANPKLKIRHMHLIPLR
ncbi:MAG: tRNA (adenosine(37)-N6)-threonylcarbamoyltransferase complex transferase subunit TsaD [Chlamydiae bacterium]|nr:tRNA (adenosine(37)-N6)-threonylcarbamoyltransferase complex transferase subunit TsaD [Chlamydiota bacterium]MBI3266235.1 tRNA (adenosine(37)-N6)-threonylcarbamoyltransferase complex transferase subunit TsaD [Chlamydiota bacterium]